MPSCKDDPIVESEVHATNEGERTCHELKLERKEILRTHQREQKSIDFMAERSEVKSIYEYRDRDR